MARNQKSNVILMKAGAMRSAGDGNPRLFTFVGGTAGPWSVMEVRAVVGDSLPMTQRLDVVSGAIPTLPPEADWALSGVTSNVRYVTAAERAALGAQQVDPGRREALRAALIPIKKSTRWWDLPQDARRRIFEDGSRHVATGLRYLPGIAR